MATTVSVRVTVTSLIVAMYMDVKDIGRRKYQPQVGTLLRLFVQKMTNNSKQYLEKNVLIVSIVISKIKTYIYNHIRFMLPV